MNDFNYDNEIIEISSDNDNSKEKMEELTLQNTIESKELQLEKPKKNKRTLKDKWRGISKKKRTIILVSLVVIIILLVVILYFTVFKREKPEIPKEEAIILEKDNYRYNDGKLIFLDRSDREIGTYECINKDPEKCMVAKLDYSTDKFERTTSVYENGEEISKSSQIYLDKYVFVSDGNKINLYNIKNGKNELEVKSIKIYGTEKDLVVIEDENSKYGLIEINSDGYDYLIRPSYDNLGIANTKLVYLVAQDKDKYYIVNSNGKKLSGNLSSNIQSVNENYVVALKNKSYDLYDYNYEELLSDYDYISLDDEVIGLVKNNRLYLRDSNLNKLNEDGMRLENSDYVKKYVYDENNRLVETKKSFEVTIKDNVAMVSIGNDTKNINMYDGIVSSNYDYINYFDGKLYFYSDKEKEELIGTYNCNNKNNLKNKDDILNNCTLYMTVDGISGIYNSNYVIIYDNANYNDSKEYVYSLKEKKVKGTYSNLEIINKKELNDNVKELYTSSSYIIAVTETGANKGNYGVIEITSDKISGRIAFNYASIIKEGNYYLLKTVDNTYSIYNNSFTKISNEFAYIKLYDKYYVGINNDKLNIYNYISTKGILENDLNVKDNKYEISFDDGITIIIDGETFNYNSNGKLIIPEIGNAEDNNGEDIDEG